MGTHALETDRIGRDKSGCTERNRPSESTHTLETTPRGTGKDMERNRPREEHPPTGDRIGRNKSGHGNKLTERRVLTSWTPHRDRRVRIRKESDLARGAHILDTASGETSQDTERIRLSEGHSHTGHRIGRDKSGYGKKLTERRELTSWVPHQETLGHRKNPTGAEALTSWRRHREGQVRTRKESDRAMGTYILETESGGTSQNTERIQPSEGHSHTGDGIGRDKLGHGKNPTGRGALTYWKPHREGDVRTRKKSDRARGTHILETKSGGTSQDKKRNRPSEGHSHPGDHIGRDKSGHATKPADRRALTN